jgi:hypothetical protein
MFVIDQRRKSIDRLTVEQDIEFCQFARFVARLVVIERRVTPGDTFEFIVKVEHDFGQRHLEIDFYTILCNENLIFQRAPFVNTQLHDGAQVIGLCNDLSHNVRLLNDVDHRRFGEPRRVMHVNDFAFARMDFIRDVRHRRDDIHIELAVKALLDNLHMQQPEETAPEAEPECQRRFGFIGQRRVVELQFLERCPQILVLIALDRIESGENHRLHILETCDRLFAGIVHMGDRIADFHVERRFNARNDIAHISCFQFIAGAHLQFQYTYFVCVVFTAGIEEFHFISLADRAVENAEIGDNAPE